jgi:putative phosphoribosyl transferase
MDAALFDDRRHAGRLLAERLSDLVGEGALVLALPRGGVPVAREIAVRIDGDLDVLVVRKLATPGQPELAMGAVAADGTVVVNHQVARAVGADPTALRNRGREMSDELARRATDLRSGRPPQPLEGRVVVVVDDGVATGATLRTGLDAVRSASAARLVVAVPVAPPEVCLALQSSADRVECLYQPGQLRAVGLWYRDFSQLTDGEVVEMLSDLADRPKLQR